jgi:predicted ATPase/class 3 adenylate cyclase
VPACSACGTENPEGAKFCLECGAPLGATAATAAVPPLAPVSTEERKVVTALFTDIVGSTATAEKLDPEDVHARLAPYYARVRAEIEDFGGSVEKFIGDAVVGLFGAPVAHEDDPERGVRAARAVHAAVEELNEQDSWLDLHVRTAVHTGEALVTTSSDIEGLGMAAGDVMNTAARIQGGAPPDGIVVGEGTYRATRHAFEYRAAEPVHGKGKSKPIPIWEVVGERPRPQRPSAQTPLVGRATELGLLLEAWERATTQRQPQLVTLVAPPGIGKTRLLVAICDRVESAAGVHWGRCLSYGAGMTYWPVAEILKDAAGILHDDDAENGSAKLGRLLEGLATDDPDELRTMAAALAIVVGVPTTPRGTYSATEMSQAELHWGLRRVLQLLSRQRPLVLVFEDLHWAEPTLLELIAELVHLERAPILLATTTRPELEESQPGFLAQAGNRTVVRVPPLDEAETRALLSELVGERPERDGTLERLAANAAGNPLFLEETVRMLAGVDLDAPADAAIPMPDTLNALIGARLDALAVKDKRVAQQAAVVGGTFWEGAVVHLEGAADGVADSLTTLERRDFVRPHQETTVTGEREYAFKHILIRDVAYERLPRGRRAELHLRFSDWLDALPGGEDEFVEILAYHLEQACLAVRSLAKSPVEAPVGTATDALSRSAEKAMRRGGLREAERFFERALELIDDVHAEEALSVRLGRARARTALGEYRQAHEELLDLASDASSLGRPEIHAGALIALGHIDQKQGRLTDARERLTEGHSRAASIGDRQLQIRAGYELGTLSGEFEAALDEGLEAFLEALTLAEEAGDAALRAEGHLKMGAAYANAGALAEAEAQFARCIEIAEELGSLRDEARGTFLLGQLRYYRVGIDEAERLALRARDWLARTGESYYQVQNLRQLALYSLARGDAQRAEEWLREALPIALEMGGWVEIDIYRYLVESLLTQGRLDDARALWSFAARSVPGEHVSAQGLLLAEAGIAAAAADADTAIERFGQALRLLDEEKVPILVAEARLDFGRALARLGRSEAARTELARARDTLAAMGADALVAAIERELAALDGAGVADPVRSS